MMLIDRIEASVVEMPLKRPFIVSFGTITHARNVVVKIYDRGGACGMGESSLTSMPVYKPEYLGSVWTTLTTVILPFLKGKSFATPEEAEKSLSFIRGNFFSKAAVSLALYDLYSQIKGESLVKTIGGTRRHLDISRTVSLYDSPDKTRDEAQKYLEDGTQWIKLKICPGKDTKQLQALREIVPDSTRLMVDANASYVYDDNTIRTFQEIDDMGLFGIEQPLYWNDIVFHSKLQRVLKTDVALDESMDDALGARQALEIGACRSGNIKLTRVGGYGEARAIERTFYNAGLPVWIGGMMESPIGFLHNLVAATMEGCTLPIDFFDAPHLVEGFFDCFSSEMYCKEKNEIRMDVSFSGLGLSLDKDFFRKSAREEAVF